MIIDGYKDIHLTYCSNIHTGENWHDHFEQLKIHLPELKRRVSPQNPFGIGLRLSAKAAGQLLDENTINLFYSWMIEKEMYLFTINGFPYGSFHGERVKDNVYVPDWSRSERLDYTLNLVHILSKLLPQGMEGGISTSPISYKYWDNNGKRLDQIRRKAAVHLADAAHVMHQVQKDLGKIIHLDIEPEPDCLLENSAETADFFLNWLFKDGASHLAETYGYTPEEADTILKEHLRVCYDTCHFALEYEDPGEAMQRFSNAGIKIGKTQVSSALKVLWSETAKSHEEIKSKLMSFDEPVYLHQVIERKKDGYFQQYRDLPEAFDLADLHEAEEWRVHFHVPVFVESFGDLNSTQDHIVDGLLHLIQKSDCTHFEVETYTWEVLPESLKADLTDSIERELNWTKNLFQSIRKALVQ